MAFFVPVSKEQSKTNQEDEERLDLRLLALGKRCELSFEEINLFRASDLLEYAEILTEKADDKPKEATQADIDAFYGR